MLLFHFRDNIDDFAPAIEAALLADRVGKALCPAIGACGKDLRLQSVVGTAVGRMPLGMSHSYNHMWEYSKYAPKGKFKSRNTMIAAFLI